MQLRLNSMISFVSKAMFRREGNLRKACFAKEIQLEHQVPYLAMGLTHKLEYSCLFNANASHAHWNYMTLSLGPSTNSYIK